MKQNRSSVLAVRLTCPTTIEVGDVVILDTAAKTVKKLDAAASVKIVGTVESHADLATECTVATRFRERRDDRVSGAAISAPGPFVFDASMKAIAYAAGTHDAAAIAGLVITTANAADVVVETLEL